MSNYQDEVRRRRRNLLIVEGNHEKNKLFSLIFKCFPEINIDIEDVWIYGTNIYLLYEDIAKEYGSQWADEKVDIDLPFVISKKQHPQFPCYKEDFINIILVFDYERHDTNFSEQKIMDMQQCFHDAADMGKLYINYPMIESYLHLKALPDCDFYTRKIPVSLQPGKKYKAQVDSETAIGKLFEFPHRIDDLLNGRFGITDEKARVECCKAVLNISEEYELERELEEALQGLSDDNCKNTLKYQLKDWLLKMGYVHRGQTYWECIRDIFGKIIFYNIHKANWLLNGEFEIEEDRYKKCYEQIDLMEILKLQNHFSRDENQGYIWVLNTCIFFVAEYNFALIN